MIEPRKEYFGEADESHYIALLVRAPELQKQWRQACTNRSTHSCRAAVILYRIWKL
ncbi:hypothetical protein [Paenibacillus lupini]|uniref:hypothetical protein n=1 Tax=Paenibacillus lupini TaxID=1450204 RepID=UPI0014243889|nr:hypothetical protein [Paenibacillus lupini]NIK22796.1 hypothetical protein [Paenibacillus lupini]